MKQGSMSGARVICRVAAVTMLWAAVPLVTGIVAPEARDGAAYAQEQKKQQETRRTPAMRERVYKKLSEAQEMVEKEQFADAINRLDELKKDEDLNSYERAMTWNFIAYTYSSQEKYKEALNAFQQVLKQPEIPVGLEQQTLYAIAQLYLANEEPRQTIKTLERWFAISDPHAQARVLWGQACFLVEDFKCAVDQVNKALALLKKAGDQQPQESWLLILRAAYYELNNIPKVIEVLEQLVHLYPKGDYFYQLSGMYGERGNEKRQLAVLEASYDGGYFSKAGEYTALASLLLNADVPYKAAKVLSEGIKKDIVEDNVRNLRMLAQAWLMAQEPQASIDVLRQAAKQSDDGELYIRLGQAHMNLDEWDNCVTAIRSGLKKGGVERDDSARVSLGICLYNTDDLDGAIEVFKQAAKVAKDESTIKFAKNWLEFLRNEKSRRRSIAESLS